MALVQPTAAQTTAAQQSEPSGYDVVVTTAFELIGVGLMAILAGINDDMGSIIVIIMFGFLIGWLLANFNTFAQWSKSW